MKGYILMDYEHVQIDHNDLTYPVWQRLVCKEVVLGEKLPSIAVNAEKHWSIVISDDAVCECAIGALHGKKWISM